MRYLAAVVLTVLIGAYAVVAVVTKDRWLGPPEIAGTAVTLAATAPDGSPPTADQMAVTQRVLQRRVAHLGPGTTVTVDGDRLVATVPGDGGATRDLTAPGAELLVRPVIHSVAAQGPVDASRMPTVPEPDAAQRIGDEKSLRQSRDQTVQILAMQFQTTRCGEPDPLAGHDDPDLPLVTCSRDGSQVYLLEPARFRGLDVASATAGRERDHDIVTLEFAPPAAQSWAQYTAKHVGTQVAYAVGTSVISAPQIMEPIPNGRVQIAGNLSADQARDLATALGGARLPVTLAVESTSPTTLTGAAPSLPLRIAMLAVGAALALAACEVIAWILLSRNTSRSA